MPRILRAPWASQPPRAVGINRHDLIGRDVLVAEYGGVNQLTGLPLTKAGSGLTKDIGQRGVQVTHSSVTASTDALYTPQTYFGPLTIFALTNVKATTSNSIVGTGGPISTFDNGGIGFKTVTSGTVYLRLVAYTSSSTAVTAVASSAPANGNWRLLVGAWDGTSGIKLYSDGVLLASNTGVSSIYTASNNFQIGNFASGNLDGSVAFSGVIGRALSASEVSAFSSNPWRILNPANSRLYFDFGAGSGGAITGTASFTESSDTAAASGRLIHYGSAAFTESNDTAAASGSVGTTGVYGDVAFTESDDTLAALGRIVHRDTATITEADDTFAAVGRLIHRGTGAFVEDDDILAASDADPLYGFTQDQLDFLVSYLEANMAIPTVEQIAAAVLAASVETGATVAESLRLSNAVLGGKVSGAGTGTETFRNPADTKDRLVVTVDSSGNRTAITLDLD